VANDKDFKVKNDLNVGGDITVVGTVDGRDVATDGTKLDTIETNAKDDQSITAGSGLTGGGTGDVTLNVGAGTGITVNANDIAIAQPVDSDADVTFATLTTTGNIIVGGDLQVSGTTTTIDTQELHVTDNMIYMADGYADSAGAPTASVDIGFAAGVNDNGSYEHVGFFRDATDDRFKVFKGYTPEPDAAVEINTGHASFSLADLQAATFYGALSGNASTASQLQTTRTIALSGDVTGSTTFNGSGNATISTTIAANSVALGTDTTGNYVATITGTTNEVEVSGSGSENAGVTIGLPNDVTIGNDLSVTNNISMSGGNFYFDGTTTYLRSDTPFYFLTDAGAAQWGAFKGLQVGTSYSATPPNDGILFGTDTTLYRSAANTLSTGTGDSLSIQSGQLAVGTSTFAGVINAHRTTNGSNLVLSNPTSTSYAQIQFDTNSSDAYIFQNGSGYSGYGGASSLNIYNSAGNAIAFHPGNQVNTMYMSSSGNVGINTTSPTSKLHVHSSADTQIRISADNSMALHQDAAWNSNLYFGAYHDGSNVVYGASSRGAFRMVNLHDGDASPQYIAFYGANAGTAGATVSWNTVGFVQDEDGNVGIGTTSPGHKLEVSGTAADGTELLHITSDGDVANGGYHWMTTEIAGSQSTNANIIHFIGKELALRNGGYFGFHYAGDNSTNNYITLGGYQADQLLNIKMDGNVGIGTTSPSSLVHVYGTDPVIRVDNSPSTGTFGYAFYRGATKNADITWNEGDANLKIKNYRNDSNIIYGNIDFHTGGTSASTAPDLRMRITTDGNVGIGTTSPYGKFHVDFTGASEKWFTMTGGSGNRLYLNQEYIAAYKFGFRSGTTGTDILVFDTQNDRVGIGTTSPSTKLHVNGTSALTGGKDPSIGNYGGDPAAVIGGFESTGNHDGSNENADASLIVISKGNNGGNSPVMRRNQIWLTGGISGEAYNSGAQWQLGRWTNASVDARSKLVLSLADDGQTWDHAMTWMAYGNGTTMAVIGQDSYSYTSGDNSRLVGSWTTNKLHVNGSIQLTNNNDAIVIGRGTASFFTDEEIGFGWGGGWYMTEGTYLRVRNNKSVYSTGDARFSLFYDSNDTTYYMNPAGTSLVNTIQYGTTSGNTKISGANDLDLYSNDDINLRSRWIRMFDGAAGTTEYARFSDGGGWHTADLWIGGTGTQSSYKLRVEGNTYNTGNAYFGGSVSVGTTSSDAIMHVQGGHSTSRYVQRYNHSSSDGNSQLLMWCSEPGISYDCAGIGSNIHVDGQYYGRDNNSNSYGVYLRFDVNNGYSEFWTTTGSSGSSGGQGTRQFRVYANGDAVATGNVTAYSDERLKTNIQKITNPLEKVSKIRGVTYDRTDTAAPMSQAGVIAQEVEKVLPEVVSEDENGIKQVAYGNMVGLLIEAIKEQQETIDKLQARVEALENN